MADAIGAGHVQGAFDEGQSALGERPVLIAGKDLAGNIAVPTINPPTKTVTGILTNPGDTVKITDIAAYGGISITIDGTITAGYVVFQGSASDIITPSSEQSVGLLTNAIAVNNAAIVFGSARAGTFTGPIGALQSIQVLAGVGFAGPVTVTITVGAYTAMLDQGTSDAVFEPIGYEQLALCGMVPFVTDGTQVTDTPNTFRNVFSVRTPSVFKPQSTVAIAAETAIWTPAAGKSFRLMGFSLTSDVSGNVTFRDNTAGTVIWVQPCLAGQPISSPPMGNGILSAAVNNKLTAQGPAASHLSGVVFGTEE